MLNKRRKSPQQHQECPDGPGEEEDLEDCINPRLSAPGIGKEKADKERDHKISNLHDISLLEYLYCAGSMPVCQYFYEL